MKLWDVNTGELLQTLGCYDSPVFSVSFSSHGQLLASVGSEDNTVKLWDVNYGRLLQNLEGHSDVVISVISAPDGKLLASGSLDNTVKLWDVNSGKLLRTLEGHTDAIHVISFSPDSKLVISGSSDKTVKLWDVNSGRLLNNLTLEGEGYSSSVRVVSFSPDGKLVASRDSKEIKLWEVESGRLLRTLEGHTNQVLSVSFSPDGKLLASGSWDNTVKLWDVNTGELLQTLGSYNSSVLSVSFSPDGKLLAAGIGDKAIKLWDVNSGRLLHTLERHDGGDIRTVSFSPDSKLLASCGGWDRTVKLWNIDKGTEIMEMETFEQGKAWITTFPAGKYTANQAGLKYLHYVQGNEIIPLPENDPNFVSKFSLPEENEPVAQPWITPNGEPWVTNRNLNPPIIQWISQPFTKVNQKKFILQAKVQSETSVFDLNVLQNNQLISCPFDDKNQLLNCEVELTEGRNIIFIQAYNQLGMGRSQPLEIEYEPPNNRKNYALIFATENYDDSDTWGRMYSTNSGATRLEKLLQSTYGFEVEIIKDPTLSDVQITLNRYAKKDYGKYDQMLLVFTGHGDVEIRSGGRIGYLVMRNSRIVNGVRQNFYHHSVLRDDANTIGIPHVLVVLDACYSSTFDTRIDNPLFGGNEPKGKYLNPEISLEKRVKELLESQSRLYLSSGEEQTLSGDSLQASPFFEAFLNALQHPEFQKDGIVKFEEVKTYIGNLKLNPLPRGGRFGDRSAIGDFLFVVKKK